MKYFVISIFYEEREVIKKPLRKSYLLEAEEFPKLLPLLESDEYEIKGYRRVGFTNFMEISKDIVDALKTLESTSTKPEADYSTTFS